MLKAVVFALFVAAVSAKLTTLEFSYPAPTGASWTNTGRQARNLNRMRTIHFAIKQQNRDALEELFWAVSDPQNEAYGQYLTTDEITEIVAPTEEAIEAVLSYVSSLGLTGELTRNRDYVVVKASLAQIEKAFHCKFTQFEHVSGHVVDATMGPYYVDSEVVAHLDLVSGILGLPVLHKAVRPQAAPEAGTEITPPVIRAAYGVPPNIVANNTNSSHAVAEFQGQYYSPTDLTKFFSEYVPYSTADTVANVVGTNQPSQPSLEGSLDIQFAMGVAPNMVSSFYSYGSDNFFGDLNTWLTELQNEDEIPYVFSVSYGTQGDYPTPAYRERQDGEYQKVGLRGTSIIYASGDYGACGDGSCNLLYASYPATSVYVTSVGATRFVSGNTGEEAAVEAFQSGGGFSDLYPVPSYQASDVQNYLQNAPNLPHPSAYNASNRATPDVSALGSEHFTVVVNGQTTPVGGTSASAPTFSAIIALLNDNLLENNKPTLGFLNNWIYQTNAADSTAFTDITIGNNECGGGEDGGSTACGYSCIAGWDPVTGVGTPNYPALLSNVMAMWEE